MILIFNLLNSSFVNYDLFWFEPTFETLNNIIWDSCTHICKTNEEVVGARTDVLGWDFRFATKPVEFMANVTKKLLILYEINFSFHRLKWWILLLFFLFTHSCFSLIGFLSKINRTMEPSFFIICNEKI